ncbi:hypothetical protein ALP01_200426 [Pseudomonas caricapapayae]|nr:hypothetical protein ALP01_200426 [Pseudomonas caricapapayae]
MKSLVGLLLYRAQHNKSKPISVLERLFRKAFASLVGSNQRGQSDVAMLVIGNVVSKCLFRLIFVNFNFT